MSRDWIKINGVHSDDLDVWVDTPPVPPMAKRRRAISQIGFDEDIVTLTDSFDNLSITMYFYQIKGFNSNNVYDNSDVFSFIAGARTLEMSRFEGWCYKVLDVSNITPIGSYNADKVKYAVTFTVSPFKYAKSNDEITLDLVTPILNYGNIFCKPIIRFTAVADIMLINTNGDFFYIDIGDYDDLPAYPEIIVDSTKMMTTIDGTVYNATTRGNYPMLNTGYNSVRTGKLEGNLITYISGGKITPNIRKR